MIGRGASRRVKGRQRAARASKAPSERAPSGADPKPAAEAAAEPATEAAAEPATESASPVDYPAELDRRRLRIEQLETQLEQARSSRRALLVFQAYLVLAVCCVVALLLMRSSGARQLYPGLADPPCDMAPSVLACAGQNSSWGTAQRASLASAMNQCEERLQTAEKRLHGLLAARSPAPSADVRRVLSDQAAPREQASDLVEAMALRLQDSLGRHPSASGAVGRAERACACPAAV